MKTVCQRRLVVAGTRLLEGGGERREKQLCWREKEGEKK